MKNIRVALCATLPLLALTSLATADEPEPEPAPCRDGACLAEGESCVIKSNGPDLKASGIPTSAVHTHSELWDKDPVGDNEKMGAMTAHPETGTLCATVKNVGGKIFGPNGEDVEGGLFGSGVECYVVHYFDYQYVETVTTTENLSPHGVGGSKSITVSTEKWAHGWVRERYRNPIDVAPC